MPLNIPRIPPLLMAMLALSCSSETDSGAAQQPVGTNGGTANMQSTSSAGASSDGAIQDDSTTTDDVASGGEPSQSTGGTSGGAGGTAMATGGDASTGGEAAGGMGGMQEMSLELPKKVLLYHKSPIDNVGAQMDILAEKLTEWGFESDRTDDPSMISSENLEQYGAVGMINNCFDAFGADGEPQAAAMKQFVEAGGGVWGNHCASVTYRDADPPHPWNQLLGGRGNNGFWEGDNTCRKMAAHPTVMDLPNEFDYNGNLDNTDFLADDITILVRCTWGGNGNEDVVVSWTREPGMGRIFFSNFAKFDNDLTDPLLGDGHLLAGLAWVLRL